MQAGFSVEDVCNQLGPPKVNIADLFEYLQQTYGNCHLLVDEFHTDNIDQHYCERLQQSLKENFQNSTLVIATQTITTTKHLIDKDQNLQEYEICGLENAGLKILEPLVKAMRVPSNIFDLTETAMDFITESDTVLVLPNTQPKRVSTKFTYPSNEDFNSTTEMEKNMNVNKLVDLQIIAKWNSETNDHNSCLLYTSPSPRDS